MSWLTRLDSTLWGACRCSGVLSFLTILPSRALPRRTHTHTQGGPYGVRINAVSVVNLVMAVGLAVEFVVHVTTAFLAPPILPSSQPSPSPLLGGGWGRRWSLWLTRSEPGKEARAKAALSSLGASVFSVRTPGP